MNTETKYMIAIAIILFSGIFIGGSIYEWSLTRHSSVYTQTQP